jgi:hypothetical protein
MVPAGLYVPTSDIDLVVMDSRCTNIQDGLKAIASALVRRQLATKIQVGNRQDELAGMAHRMEPVGPQQLCQELHIGMAWHQCRCKYSLTSVHVTFQVIGKARVPIIKFESTGYGGIAFDVSFDVANGPQVCRDPFSVINRTTPCCLANPMFAEAEACSWQHRPRQVYTAAPAAAAAESAYGTGACCWPTTMFLLPHNMGPLQAAELVREFVDMWPMMRPLVLVLKLFLQQRELNEVYTGGQGSVLPLVLPVV